jgi:hypothetical protein
VVRVSNIDNCSTTADSPTQSGQYLHSNEPQCTFFTCGCSCGHGQSFLGKHLTGGRRFGQIMEYYLKRAEVENAPDPVDTCEASGLWKVALCV